MIRLKHSLFIIALFLTLSNFAQTHFSAINLKCDSKVNPIGLAVKNPLLSWELHSTDRDISQSAYQILVSESLEKLNNQIGDCWDSKVVKSNQSTIIPYSGVALNPEKRYYWKVKVLNQKGKESAWSEPASWEMGLLSNADWEKAIWISYENLPTNMTVVPGVPGDGEKLGKKAVQRSVVPLFRKEFKAEKEVKNATLFISGLGSYEASINGQKIGESFLTPGWTDYAKVCLYNTYDVSSKIKMGNNAIGVIVGNGFYNINRERYRKLIIAYGYPTMISKLKINYTDGSSKTIVSDNTWKCTLSPIIYSSIYGGEDYDARAEQKGWNMPDFKEIKWKPALVATKPKGELTSETDNPITIHETINVKEIDHPEPGKYLYDFGQNCSGIIELKVTGKRGSIIKMTPGELITPDRKINQKASGTPYTLSYTLKGEGVETWRPRFTYYGFRYVMVEGGAPAAEKPGKYKPSIINMQLLHTCNSAPRVGEFSCSNDLFNQINTLIDWAIRSNIQSVVTDCPHREKLGWLEQTYLMGASMFYNYNLYPLYRKAIRDMIDAQTVEGLVPDIAPEFVPFSGGFRDSPEWGSAGVILPFMLWQWYGDLSVVEEALPMMRRYVNYLDKKSDGHILDYGLGDWVDLGPKPLGEAQLTPKALTATAIYYYDITLLAKMLRATNNKDEATKLDDLAIEVKKAFNAKFYNKKNKTYSTGSQTAIAMPLYVGLVDEKERKNVVKSLVESINDSKKALTAGDIGFHFLVKALEENGCSPLLFDMNFRNDVPGYGFQLKKGATALTESWPALENVSNNHLMLGHLMEWFYTGLGGIKQEEGGISFKNIVIRPEIVGDLTWVKSSYHSPYGLIKSNWKKEVTALEMKIEIPANTSATIFFPTAQKSSITEDGKKITVQKNGDGKFYTKIGSGNYTFRIDYVTPKK